MLSKHSFPLTSFRSSGYIYSSNCSASAVSYILLTKGRGITDNGVCGEMSVNVTRTASKEYYGLVMLGGWIDLAQDRER